MTGLSSPGFDFRAPSQTAIYLNSEPQSADDAMWFARNLDLLRRAIQGPPMSSRPSTHLETFENPHPQREYTIRFECPEFTCVCPKTGQPDFATIRIKYAPAKTCVELKSLKLYLWSYRDLGAFHEAVTNKILDDLVAATEPRWMEVEGDFYVRGGIHTVIEVRHQQPFS